MIDQLDEEMNKIVLDKWAIRMIKEKKIPDELKSKSLRKKLEDLAGELNITLESENPLTPPPWPMAPSLEIEKVVEESTIPKENGSEKDG